MKIITTTIEDFVKAELDEWGFDYVEAKFAEGYEPCFVNGYWEWHVKHSDAISSSGSNSLGTDLSNSTSRVRLVVR